MEGVFIWVVIVVGIINIFQNILKIIFQKINISNNKKKNLIYNKCF
jgi:hypothetical protein